MSVQTEIDRIIELVDDSHEAVKAKGGTTSTPYLLANLPDAIESIPAGVEPNGDTLVWDGDTEGLTPVLDIYFKISDVVPTVNDCANGLTIIFKIIEGGEELSESFSIPGEGVQEFFSEDGLFFYDFITIIPTDNYAFPYFPGVVFPEAGIYFIKQLKDSATGYVSSLTINGYTGFPCISVPANPILQEKTVTPATSAQAVTPDSGYDGLSKVNVNAMPSATQATPSITVSSAGLITASATQSAGYVASGTKSATKQLTTQAAKTVTPTTSEQTAVESGVYTTGAVKVGAIPSSYVKPTATKGATTYTPSTSNQTIASGTYCSGTQTIKGDANLVAGNIKSGVSIFGVAGNYEGSGGGGGGSFEKLSVTVTDNGMFEPGANQYILDIPGLNFSTRNLVVLCAKYRKSTTLSDVEIVLCVFDSSIEADFARDKKWNGLFAQIGLSSIVEVQENSFYVYGDLSVNAYLEFVVYAG